LGKRRSGKHGSFWGIWLKKGKEFFCNFIYLLLLKQGHVVVDFEATKLFQFLKVKNTPRKHWNNNVRWEIARYALLVIK